MRESLRTTFTLAQRKVALEANLRVASHLILLMCPESITSDAGKYCAEHADIGCNWGKCTIRALGLETVRYPADRKQLGDLVKADIMCKPWQNYMDGSTISTCELALVNNMNRICGISLCMEPPS